MHDDQASHTAEGAAAMRAAGCYERDAALRNPDTLAERLVRPKFQRIVKNGLIRRLALGYYGYRLPGMYEAHLARSHHYDAVVREAIAQGIQQYVLLGAGLDSRPYRFREALDGVKVFEVDHPATSVFKRARLKAAKIDASHVTFVEVDFLTQRAEERLAESGFDPSLPTLITWEGVTMYLDDEAVSQVMRFTAGLGPGSSIVFDYVFPTFYTAPQTWPNARRHLDYVAKAGEPYTFGLELDEAGDFISRCGLHLHENIDASEMNRRYLQGKTGVTPWYAIAHAVLPQEAD